MDIVELALKYIQEGKSYQEAYQLAKKELKVEVKPKTEDRKIKKSQLMLSLSLPKMLYHWKLIVDNVQNKELQTIAYALAIYPARPKSFIICDKSIKQDNLYISIAKIKRNINYIILPRPLPLPLSMNYSTFKVSLAKLYAKLVKNADLATNVSYVKNIFRHAYIKYFYDVYKFDLTYLDQNLLQHANKSNIKYYFEFDIEKFMKETFIPKMLEMPEYKAIWDVIKYD
ncbi:MAG: hypothetical protein QXT65_04535 [Candidatus Nitrosocaldaceae archaeon]